MLRGRGYRVRFNKFFNYWYQYFHFKTMCLLYHGTVDDINRFERQIYSQNGEDGLIEYIFKKIGTANRYFVEIGAGNGVENNTRYLKGKGWNGLQIDGKRSKGLKNYFVTAKNVESILMENHVPKKFDLLSIDIDGMDFWVWKAISHFHPRVVVIEYNSSIPPHKKLTVKYDSKFVWDGTTFFGASLGALSKLAKQKGYSLVATNSNGINAFFVDKHYYGKVLSKYKTDSQLYHPPSFRFQIDKSMVGHPPSPKMPQMISV